jgi:NDP-sugar pyrophosphorylase family protein
MGKYYLICQKGQDIEVVHPSQAKTTDKVLFQAEADVWNDFCLYIGDRFFNLTIEELIKEYKKFESEWYNE